MEPSRVVRAAGVSAGAVVGRHMRLSSGGVIRRCGAVYVIAARAVFDCVGIVECRNDIDECRSVGVGIKQDPAVYIQGTPAREV